MVTVRGKIISTDDIYELPECASNLILDAKQQREFAENMHNLITECRKQDFSWEEIATMVGLPRETVYRQYVGGRGIWVGRASHKKQKNATDE